MESSRFDRLARAVGTRRTRRAVTALLGALLAVPPSGEHPGAARKKKKKKVTLCHNGATITVPKKKKGSFLRKGATSGACTGTGNTNCPAGTKGCNGACIDAGSCCTTSDCDPCLREVCVSGRCECPAGMIRDGKGVCSIPRACQTTWQPAGQPEQCCSGQAQANAPGTYTCLPGTTTCTIDQDCLYGQKCLGNLCGSAYVAVTGEQCASRAFKTCNARSECDTAYCADNLCRPCSTSTQCGDDYLDDAFTCRCINGRCVTRHRLAVKLAASCSQCPQGTVYCEEPLPSIAECWPLCGRRLQ